MKFKIGLFTLLIGLVSLGGFGQITSDPDQNSTTISTDINVTDSAIVMNQIQLPMDNIGDVQSTMERVSETNRTFLSFEAIKEMSNEQKFVLSESVKPPDIYKWGSTKTMVAAIAKSPGGELSLFYR